MRRDVPERAKLSFSEPIQCVQRTSASDFANLRRRCRQTGKLRRCENCLRGPNIFSESVSTSNVYVENRHKASSVTRRQRRAKVPRDVPERTKLSFSETAPSRQRTSTSARVNLKKKRYKTTTSTLQRWRAKIPRDVPERAKQSFSPTLQHLRRTSTKRHHRQDDGGERRYREMCLSEPNYNVYSERLRRNASIE